jgi:DNA repair exonuclease SbcCD nuclease subunit
MKVALITDTHWGVRNDSLISHNYMKRFLDDVFFPTLEKERIDLVFHLGDIVDRRKYINYVSARRLREDFLEPLANKNIYMHVIAGNHDTFYKNTNSVNALDELIVGKYSNISVYTDPTELSVDGLKVLLLPWICPENSEASMEAIKNTKAQVAFGHLELAGFEVLRGHVSDHGDDPKLFDKFDIVCSGHYHCKSSAGNIYYLGAPCQYTWSDYNDSKGFHIFDTDTRELSFVANPYVIFHKFFYDDLNKNMDEVLVFDSEHYRGCYVKVVVKNKTNPYWFDTVIDRLEKSGVADLQVVEDHFHLDLEEDSDIVSEAEDTMTILRKFITGMQFGSDKKRVENIIQNLYIEAQSVS